MLQGDKLSVMLINNYFPPEIGAASNLYYYLSKELIRRGHVVTVLTGIPRYNVSLETYNKYVRRSKKSSFLEQVEGINVIRVKLPYIERKNILRRGIEHFEIAWKLCSYGREYFKDTDVALVYSPPLTLYRTAEKIRKFIGTPYILNVQDLFPQAAIDLGIMKNKLVISFFKFMEKSAYKSADLITVHSENNAKFVRKIADNDQKVVIVENWIDENEIRPGDKINDFSVKYSLTDKFVVSFAGTLGFSQDIEVVIKAANELRGVKDIVFVFVGDGVRLEEAKNMSLELGLKNILFLPSVPKEEYPLVLHSSDISLATLTKDVKTPVIPSKILNIMSAGVPVIASMNPDGDAPGLIERAKAGFCVPAGDYNSLAEKILLIYKNPTLKESLGKNGREYATKHLSVRRAATEYEKLFYRLIKRRSD